MDNYIPLKQIPHMWNLSEGDVVLLSSDIKQLAFICLENEGDFDIDIFLDEVLEVIGKEGTLLLPVYNWEFCHGIPFNYKKTKGMTGSLGNLALKRTDCKRTQHALYSFAVIGKDKDYLCSLENITSFGADSPFAYFHRNNAKNVMIDVDYTHCFTYVHYVEEGLGLNSYRFQKSFTSEYINSDGYTELKTYSMLVRNLALYQKTDFEPLGDILEQNGVSCVYVINGIKYRVVDMAQSTSFIEEDILHNNSRRLCTYIGQ